VLVGILVLVGLSGAARAELVTAGLSSLQEVPSNITGGKGVFLGNITAGDASIDYNLLYFALEGGAVTAAHIHVGQEGANGAISAFLCGGGGKPACPAPGTLVTGTITAADVGASGAGQGVGAGELGNLLQAIRAGKAYVNVHTTSFPAGEVRGQLP
jgi:hypothetical protein